MKKAIPVLLVLALAAMPAAADLVLNQEDIAWTTESGIVTFHLRFYNPDPTVSMLETGEMFAQDFGAFVPDLSPIGTFDIPPIEPESFFDVFFEIPLSQLPPSAHEVLPWQPGKDLLPCPPDWHWDGNVDVIWTGPGGGGMTQAHYGTLQVCPGQGGSYIHVVTNCAGWAAWAVVGLCAGFNATLVNEDLSPAPNPVPPMWSGFIAVTAAAWVPVNTQCCFAVNFTCGGVTIPVNLCVVTCDCGPVLNEVESWGSIKALYK